MISAVNVPLDNSVNLPDDSMDPNEKRVKSPVEDIELLTRKMGNKHDKDGHATSAQPMESYTRILAQGSTFEIFIYLLGHLCFAIMGLAIPSTFFFLGDAFDAFGPGSTDEELMDEIKRLTVIMVLIAGISAVLGYLGWALMNDFALRVSRRIRQKYLTAILN